MELQLQTLSGDKDKALRRDDLEELARRLSDEADQVASRSVLEIQRHITKTSPQPPAAPQAEHELRRVAGIGPAKAEALISEHVESLKELASLTDQRITELIESRKDLSSLRYWVAAAKKLLEKDA